MRLQVSDIASEPYPARLSPKKEVGNSEDVNNWNPKTPMITLRTPDPAMSHGMLFNMIPKKMKVSVSVSGRNRKMPDSVSTKRIDGMPDMPLLY
jgi:hypothetical protein